MSNWFKCNLVDANILNKELYEQGLMVWTGSGATSFEVVSFSTDKAFNLEPVINLYLTQVATEIGLDYAYTEQIVLTHTSTPNGGSPSSSSYTMNMKFKVFGGTLYPVSGRLLTTLYGVDMGLLTYTQRSTGVLQVTKDNILSVTGYDIARYNAAAVYCSPITINSQTTNQIRFNSNVPAASAASTYSGHYLVYELAHAIYDAHFGSHPYAISANTTNVIEMSGAQHDGSSEFYYLASVKKHLGI